MLSELLNQLSQKRQLKTILFFAILMAFTAIMVASYQPLCPGQDFFFHFRRLDALMEALRNGNYGFYLDENAIDGYGYFTKAFYPDLVLVPFALVGLATNTVFAYNCMLFVMTFLCGTFTFIAVRKIFKCTMAASIAALLYTFCTYRLLDIYHRAAIGEVLTFTFIPLVFLGLYHIIRGDFRRWYILAIGFSLMLYSHLISSVLMFITIIVFIAIYNKSLRSDRKRIQFLILSGIVAIFLTAYYTFPMIEQMLSNTFYYESRQMMAKAEDAQMQIHWIVWGLFGGIVQPKQIFIPGVGILLTAAVCLRLFVHDKSKKLKGADTLVIVGLFYLFAISSFFPWSIFLFNKLNFIQLPWRLYEFISFFFAVAGGYYFVEALKSYKRRLVAGSLTLATTAFIIVNDASLYKEIRCKGDMNEKATVENAYHLGGLEYIPESVPSIEYLAKRGKTFDANNEFTLSNFKKDNGKTSFDINLNHSCQVELPLIYYKGYEAYLDGENLALHESQNGLVEISILQSGNIDVFYAGTLVQKISIWLSILSIIALCTFIIFQYKKNEFDK